MEKSKQIINILKEVCENTGLPIEIDRRYPVSTDTQIEGAPDDMPLIVIRNSQRKNEDPSFKNPYLRWRFAPKVVFYLQNKDNPDDLTDYSETMFYNFIDDIKNSDLDKVIMQRTAPDITMELQPFPGRPDVLVMIIVVEVVFER